MIDFVKADTAMRIKSIFRHILETNVAYCGVEGTLVLHNTTRVSIDESLNATKRKVGVKNQAKIVSYRELVGLGMTFS